MSRKKTAEDTNNSKFRINKTNEMKKHIVNLQEKKRMK